MKDSVLVLFMPVVHAGYINLLHSLEVEKVYLLDLEFVDSLYEYEPDIASLDTEITRSFLGSIGFDNIEELSEEMIKKLSGKNIILVDDDVSRNLAEEYLDQENIEWKDVFLRWDRESVMSDDSGDFETTDKEEHKKLMKEAYNESNKSSDWWRQVGAVLVRDGKVVLRSYNQGVPSDHTPYQKGGIRDYMDPGEKPEFSPTIHAEQNIIVDAASSEKNIAGTHLYVTHFPCPVCAKLISRSGITKLFFAEGSASTIGKSELDAAGVGCVRVNL